MATNASSAPQNTSTPVETPKPTSTAATSKSSGVSTGAVVGIAIGVGFGAALIAALVTFLIMHHRDKVRRRRLYQGSKKDEHGGSHEGLKQEKPSPAKADDYLPQPADDREVQTQTKTVFDQVDLFVQNFCTVKPDSKSKPKVAEFSTFESPHLSNSLADSLQRVRDAHSLIKHSIANYVTSRISTSTKIEETLLPADLILLAGAIGVNANKRGLSTCLSQWRVITAYIRPEPSSDDGYVAERERKIAQSVQAFLRAFAPWMKPKYSEKDRTLALTTVLREAAGLGIFLLSQPHELIFHWPRATEMDSGYLATAPSLLKVTDEHGQRLASAQPLVQAVVAKL